MLLIDTNSKYVAADCDFSGFLRAIQTTVTSEQCSCHQSLVVHPSRDSVG